MIHNQATVGSEKIDHDVLQELKYQHSWTADPEGFQRFIGYLENPDFENRGRVHDWRNYVPELLFSRWALLPLTIRAILWLDAESQSSREEWE
jgi:hypothetical protein